MARLRRRITALSLALLVASPARAEAPPPTAIRVVDALGAETVLPRAPARVLPLMPSLAELVSALGLPEARIVGVTEYADFPPSLKAKPSIGPYSRPNLERIAALRPDLVLAGRDGTPKDVVARARALGFPVVTVATESLAGVRESYPIVGRALGREPEAAAALAELDRKLAALRARAKTRAPRTVLLQVGEDPAVVAAGNTYLHEGLEIIGAKNVYPDPRRTYPRVSVEDVLRRKPDVIVLVGMGADHAKFERAVARWRAFPPLRAPPRPTRVELLWSDALVRPGPRFPDGLVALERTVFPTEPTAAEKDSP